MPMCAILCVARPIASTPLILMDPLREPTKPRIDLSVVVRPAPLRPSSVTTSPSFTTRSTPCRMCDSPYHTFSPLIASACLPAPMLVHRAHVGFDDARVLRDFGVRAFGKHRAALQDRNRVGNAGDHAHVVLDH